VERNQLNVMRTRGYETRDRFRQSQDISEASRDHEEIQPYLAGRRSLRVLVADDDRDTADSLAMLLKLWGHDVQSAYDALTAFEMSLAYWPDVMLLDLAMPKVNGFTLAQQVRREPRFSGSLLVAITGYGDAAHRLLCQRAFDHYLVKPVMPALLEELLLIHQVRLAESRETPRVSLRPYGILVVDDEEDIRGMLAAGMRQEGFIVWLAADGQEAIEHYREHDRDVDVVLLDVHMPKLDGPQTLAALHELNPQVRCCFMSGDPGCEEERLRELGATALFRKPFRLPEVAKVLRRLAADRATGDSSFRLQGLSARDVVADRVLS
jgi:CheY-like chemotaxis protein